MGALFLWVENHWFSLIQTTGIIGGLLFTAISIRQSTNSRKASDLLALTEQHRHLWNEVYSRPDLSRVYAEKLDLVAHPVTVQEERFLNEVIVHFQTGWQLASHGSLLTIGAMKADTRTFFRLPLPKASWESTKAGRDRKFIRFVDKCLRKAAPT